MKYIIAGLGNPGSEYEDTRHNAGRRALTLFQKKNSFSEWSEVKKAKALVSSGKAGKEEVLLLLPETYMNASGRAVKSYVTSQKKAEKLIVIHDDLDLPLGGMKISFSRGSGGHRGLESIIKNVRTKNFIRIRIGISPATARGKLKKPKGEKQVVDFILGTMTKRESEILRKVFKRVNEALLSVIRDGYERAMNQFN